MTLLLSQAVPSLVPEKLDLQGLFLIAGAIGFVPLITSAWMLKWGLEASVGRGPLSSFFERQLFYPQLQTALGLKISIDCFLTVLASRTEGPFMSRPPGRLLVAVLAMAISVASFIAVAFPMGGTDPINMGACPCLCRCTGHSRAVQCAERRWIALCRPWACRVIPCRVDYGSLGIFSGLIYSPRLHQSARGILPRAHDAHHQQTGASSSHPLTVPTCRRLSRFSHSPSPQTHAYQLLQELGLLKPFRQIPKALLKELLSPASLSGVSVDSGIEGTPMQRLGGGGGGGGGTGIRRGSLESLSSAGGSSLAAGAAGDKGGASALRKRVREAATRPRARLSPPARLPSLFPAITRPLSHHSRFSPPAAVPTRWAGEQRPGIERPSGAPLQPRERNSGCESRCGKRADWRARHAR